MFICFFLFLYDLQQKKLYVFIYFFFLILKVFTFLLLPSQKLVSEIGLRNWSQKLVCTQEMILG